MSTPKAKIKWNKMWDKLSKYKDYGAADSEGIAYVKESVYLSIIKKKMVMLEGTRSGRASAWQLFDMPGKEKVAKSLDTSLKSLIKQILKDRGINT